MAWLSGGGGGRGSAASSVAALACTDGTLRLVNGATGREEKRVSATTAGAVICVAADPSGSTLATGNEDGAVKVWSRAGMLRATVATADSPVFAVCWDSTSERLLYASGKQLSVRSVAGDRASSKASTSWKAHDGAVLCADWCAVHSLIVSGGEDCRFKVWDAEGRALFASAPMLHPITAVAWAPRGESFAVGSFETLRLCDRAGWSLARQSLASTNVGSGRVGTAAAASASVSGAGAASGSASASGAATAAASVSGGGADGDAGSGGAFGSVFALAWSADGTALAVGGAGGRVVLAQPLGRRVSEGGLFAEHSSSREVRVVDASDGTTELLELRDRVTHVSLAYSRLVVCTETQCHVYDAGRRAWGTPHSSDLKAPATLLLQGTRHILIADASGAFTLLGEDGRPTSTAFGSAIARGLGSTAARAAACADASSLALAPDCIAVLDRADGRTVRTFDIRSGRAVGAVYEHPVPVRQIALSQFTPGLPERRLAVVDTAGDLWVTPVMAPEPEKLASMVESAAWCDAGDMLLACADGKQVLWHCPAAVWVDRDLCERAKEETPAPALGRIPRILTYRGSRCVVRRGDGAVIHSAVNTNTPLLYELVRGARWEHAVRLCRQAKEQPLWATLASLSLSASQLDTAEIALAALGMSDKLAFVLHVRDVPSEEGRAAEMALFRRCPDEAEAVLLHASPPLLYRAVKLNIRLFRWERALQLAREADAGVGGSPSLTEIVVGARQRLLEALGREETLVSFKEAQAAIGGAVDWDRVQTTKASQREAEIAAVSGGAYGGERG
jgi:intraflagellar transport protein 80